MDYAGRRKIWYLLSAILILPGLISLFTQGLNLGIDFTGGNIMEISFEKNVTPSDLRSVVDELGVPASSIQEAGENRFYLRTNEMNEELGNNFRATLKERFGNMEVLRNERVGAIIGGELTRNAILALVIAIILMIIYIGIRFEFFFGVSAIIALLHDALITVGIYSLLRVEIDSTFVAAILTIIGYSINDTIVIFDRIRENLKLHPKEDKLILVNRSISQSLTRSIITVSTVVMALVALLVLGGETTKQFSGAMLIGTVAGAYSSIFTASPLWIDLHNLLGKKGGRGSRR